MTSLFTKDKQFYSRLFSLILVIALQNLVVFSVNLADNVMLGGYSEAGLSGVALVNQIQFLLQMLVMGVAEGIVVLSARYWGRKEILSIRKVTAIGMLLALIVAMAMFACVQIFPRQALGFFSNDQPIITEGAKYLRIVSLTYPFFAMSSILLAMLRSVETVKVGFMVSVSTLIINVCFNYTLIYGHFGAPELGVEGAAIATLISRVVEFIIIAVYLAKFDKKVQIRFKDFFHYDKEMFLLYLRIGAPVIGSNAVWGVAQAFQTSILGHLGPEAIAANSIASTVFQIVSVICYGSASATSIVIGKTIGEGNAHKVKEYAITLEIIYLIIGVCSGLFLFLFKDVVISSYGSISPESYQLSLQFMTVLSVTICGTAYQMPCLTGIVRSGGDTKFVLINDSIFMWLIVLPASFLAAFVFNLSPVVVFACLKSDQILKCFVAIPKVNRFRWIRAFSAKDQVQEEPASASQQ